MEFWFAVRHSPRGLSLIDHDLAAISHDFGGRVVQQIAAHQLGVASSFRADLGHTVVAHQTRLDRHA